MAKKMTAKQRKAAKRKSYIKSEYKKTLDALSFINENIQQVAVNIPKKITKASLKAIRKKYTDVKKQLQKQGWALPTKEQMYKAQREERKAKQATTQQDEQQEEQFNPYEDYIDTLLNVLSELSFVGSAADTPRKMEYNQNRVQEAKNRMFDTIAYARTKLGDELLAQTLAENSYVQRVEALQLRYAYEVIESIDDDLIPLLDSAVGNALDNI